MEIPRIIHQIWSEKYIPLPKELIELTESWKEFHPDWEYIMWNDAMINEFLQSKYPQYLETYYKYPHDVQRWDAIRFLIMYEYGGLYVDVDYLCLKNVEPLLKGACCLAQEPSSHQFSFSKNITITNAFIGVVPKTPFMGKIVRKIWDTPLPSQEKGESIFDYCLRSTSLGLVTETYHNYSDKEEVYIIPAELVSPFSKEEIVAYHEEDIPIPNVEERLEKAYAVHYFSGTWVKRLIY